MYIKDVIQHLEHWAPKEFQESYDNSGLIVGDITTEIKGVLVCLDSTEEIVDEAIQKGCNLIVAHHPIVFSGLKTFTGKTYIERTIIKAIKNDVAIYAIHTNLDSVSTGVNWQIGQKLGIKNLKILSPKQNSLKKLITYVPNAHLDSVRTALFEAGAGNVGKYSECSFKSEGEGTFKPNNAAEPFVGEVGKLHFEKELRLEVLVSKENVNQVLNALTSSHPYEEVAYELISLDNSRNDIGSGMIGELEKPTQALEFLNHVKKEMNVGVVRYTSLPEKLIQRVAFCGGSGGFLLNAAKLNKADIFITADYKYHQFFDAENEIVIADIGHFESEQYTIDLIATYISKKFTKFAVRLTDVNTNPVNYL